MNHFYCVPKSFMYLKKVNEIFLTQLDLVWFLSHSLSVSLSLSLSVSLFPSVFNTIFSEINPKVCRKLVSNLIFRLSLRTHCTLRTSVLKKFVFFGFVLCVYQFCVTSDLKSRWFDEFWFAFKKHWNYRNIYDNYTEQSLLKRSPIQTNRSVSSLLPLRRRPFPGHYLSLSRIISSHWPVISDHKCHKILLISLSMRRYRYPLVPRR